MAFAEGPDRVVLSSSWSAIGTPTLGIARDRGIADTPAGDLCAKFERKIDPDIQIEETDLATENARDAATDLLRILQSDVVAPKDQFAVLNRLQVVVGYTLRQVAVEDIAQYGKGSTQAQASEKKFCDWLVEKGFWYD